MESSAAHDDRPPRRRHRRRKRRRPEPGRPARTVEFLRTAWGPISERAAERSAGWLLFVLLLTVSLAMDAVLRSGFVPGLFNGLTFLNFIVHEFGHLACQLTPQWIHVAAGTVFQLALPIGAFFMFIRQRDDAASCFSLCWLAVSLMHTADYMADARSMSSDMTLSAGFWSLTSGQQVRPDEVGHDWNYLLDSVGLLAWDRHLATVVRVTAGTMALAAVIANCGMVWSAFRSKRRISSS